MKRKNLTQNEIFRLAHSLDFEKIMTMARYYEREFRLLEKSPDCDSKEFTCDVINENSFEKYDQPYVYHSIRRYLKNKKLNDLDLNLISYNFLKKHAVSFA